jgi:hypothetical protein
MGFKNVFAITDICKENAILFAFPVVHRSSDLFVTSAHHRSHHSIPDFELQVACESPESTCESSG